MEKVIFSWSGGKDSALALFELRRRGEYDVGTLITTVTDSYDRISMHGVRRALLEKQAFSLGLPLEIVNISTNATNEEYELKMAAMLEKHKRAGINKVAFGDIFLEDLRRYRAEKLAEVGMEAIFPIWNRDTGELIRSLMALGFKAITTCVDTHMIDGKFVGRLVDEDLVGELPVGADSCGENGEYHSFVFEGPIFSERIDFQIGEKVLREGRFYFCDLM